MQQRENRGSSFVATNPYMGMGMGMGMVANARLAFRACSGSHATHITPAIPAEVLDPLPGRKRGLNGRGCLLARGQVWQSRRIGGCGLAAGGLRE